jgi:hypothetical protein
MKVLLTGSNGNLGKIISNNLKKLQIELVEASSKPFESQRYFDLNYCPKKELLTDIDLVIHCARGNNSTHLKNDSEFVNICKLNDCPIIYIGSNSGNLLKPNQYGEYKKFIENIVIKNQGTVVTCGLLYGHSFYGQVKSLKKVLRKLPFSVQLDGANEQYLTPVEGLISELIFQIRNQQRGSRIFIAHKIPINFNVLLVRLGGIKPFSFTIRKKMVLFIFKIMNIKLNYFNSDSILGIYSEYKKDFKLQYIDKSEAIDAEHSWRAM